MRARFFKRAVQALFLLAASSAAAEPARPPDNVRNFIACPIIRDTDVTPCWLAEYKGELYYLGLQQDTEAAFFPPQQKHKALIQGTVTDAPRICGGIVLNPVNADTLAPIDESCQKVLPGEGYVVPPARRGALPRSTGYQLATDPIDRDPPLNPVQPPKPPFTAKTFDLPFEYDSFFMLNKATRALTQAWLYANAVKASRIEVVAYRGGALLSNGQRMTEAPGIAEKRAKAVEFSLRDLEVGETEIVISWKTEPEPVDGVSDVRTRRVSVAIVP